MIQNSDASSRRILTFPAVHPCSSISPASLLSSLITLARKICGFKSEFFTSNKRNARESIRLIGILLIFLEEIQDWQLGLLDSVVLSFSELHLTFQKVLFLLEDCDRSGARLWLLMKSKHLANQFRVLIRGISTALDVVDLESIGGFSIEVKEMVELVVKQARKGRFEVEGDDVRVLNEVLSILNRFEGKVVPSRSDLRGVLDYLGIKSWGECDKEVKFLDSDIGFEYSNVLEEEREKNERERVFLSSLLGFMSYCRCVMFDVVGYGKDERENDSRCSSSASTDEHLLSCLNADDFQCPISLEFMTDPVVLATGHTYDRSSIITWFKAGNPICPKTGERLLNKELIPNLALQKLIRHYCSNNGIPIADSSTRKHDISRTVQAGSPAAEGAVRMLAEFITSSLVNGTSEERNKAAYEIRLLAKRSIFNRSCLAEAGTISPLLNLLCCSICQENAIAALLNLSKHSKGKRIIVDCGGLKFILHVLKMGQKMEAQQHAAAVLFYLSSVEEYRKIIGEIPEAIPGLVDLIKDGTNSCKKNALVSIFGLLMHPDNHWRVLAAGAIPLLLNLLISSDEDDLVTDSLAVLATLAEKPDGTIALLRRGGLNLAVGILNSSSTSRAGKEYCVSLLLALCINGGGDVVAVLVNNPSLMEPLYALLTKGTSRASKKASSLIRILHRFYERSNSGLKTLTLPHDRFVHVQ